ncbi:ABC transporter permease subunit [Flexivirga oryzae]|uniref:N,N'-diacetylchitobiose transport system permease protein n=1 Tax=Flexivirga oryzae TaxID=1794944 RepID=A0A839NBS7_9MICO|nr:N,N'-diacetylchitobiose transport system permease protein [Flexivirga oryzae]
MSSRNKVGRKGGLLVNSLAICWVFPVYWMLNTALKPRKDVMSATPKFFPSPPSFDNFRTALTQTNFAEDLRNSVIVVGATVLIALALGLFAAAALTRFKFRGRRTIMISVLIVQMVPPSALLIPTFLVFNKIGLLGTYLGLILAYLALVLPFSIWVMRGFFLAVPVEVEEAGRLDGASQWQILTKILFPLVAPGAVATSIFTFITAWNDYLIAYTFMQDQSRYTLPVWLASFSTPDKGTDFAGQMAASVLFSLPVVIFFLFLQRRLVSGMSAGAVKG